MVIAIDGPAGAGKSTVARGVADALGFTYLDSGAMYRCVALAALRRGADLDDPAETGAIARSIEIALDDGRVELDGADVTNEIRTPEVDLAASRVSIHSQVREEMVKLQQAKIESGRYVAEGRDIGTVVSPDAPLKVFLTASDEVRAQRRAEESRALLEDVVEAQRERDARDIGREHSALRPADDAIELDTTELSVAEVVEEVVKMARERDIA
jgi:cytidylate kinase